MPAAFRDEARHVGRQLDEKRYPATSTAFGRAHFDNGTKACPLARYGARPQQRLDEGFLRETYENTRRNGIVRMGWFPA